MKRIIDWAALGLASCLFLTYLPAALRRGARWTGAGLIGTLAGLATVRALRPEALAQAAVLTGLFLISVAVSDRAEQLMRVADDPRIVIDEWIGYWVSVAFLPHTWFVLGLGAVLFRVFDVWKPGPIAQAARWPGGWGIVMDDVAAGVLANLCLRVLRYIYPL